MSGRRRQTLSPSLFPFLAVLVCTLGTLILLLALVAQNATEAAEQSARAKQAAAQRDALADQSPRLAAAAVNDLIGEEKLRIEHLVAVRDQQTADVEERRDRLTHLEDHIDRLRQQLQQLRIEVERATGDAPTNVIDVSAIEELKEEIARQELALSDLRAESENASPRVVIVPHKGPNGTDRRPIYLECTRDGVTIWPEGSQIPTLHLADSVTSANPLDSALRAIRFHALQTYGDQTAPYPMLVVRPDGIESYAAARKAMSDWDDQFGYELVPGDVKLAFPQPDATLKQRIDVAIRNAAAKQSARHVIAGRSSNRYNKKLPTLSAASLDREGRAGGFRSHRERYSPSPGQSPYVSGPAYSSGSAYTAGAGAGGPGGNGSEAVRRLDEHLRTAADELAGQKKNEFASADGQPFGQAGTATNPSGSGQNRLATESGAASPNTAAQGAPFVPQMNPFGGPLTGSQSNAARQPGGGTPPSMKSDQLAQATLSETQTNGFLRQENKANSSEPMQGQPGSLTQMSSDGAVNGDAKIGADQVDPNANVPRNSQGTSRSAAPRGAMAQTPNMRRDQTGQAPPPGASTTPSASGQAPSQDLVQRRGNNWALPRSLAGAHGNKIIRTIRVQCYEDRFVLLPSAGGGATEMFGFSDGHINRATLELATAVRDRVARWGAAIPGGRWQPRLDVEVMRHGEARYHQLRMLMNGSGVEVTGRGTR